MSLLKSMREACADMVLGRRTVWDVVKAQRTVRVAVVGGKKCGKTVFLAALANHLRGHRRGDFQIGGRAVYWDSNAAAEMPPDGLPAFDYVGAFGALKRGAWPEKTADTSILSMRLMLEDATRTNRENVQLEILDIPGERISDCPMMGKSYREWCQWREAVFAGPAGISPAYRDYLQRIKDFGPADEKLLLDAYRDFVAYEYEHFTADVSPSTLLLELDGTKHGGTRRADGQLDFREEIGHLPLGFKDENGVDCEFAPLPVSCFEKTSPFYSLACKFGSAYDRYVKRVIRPMERWLRGAQKMVYLVDVLTLLQAGADAWDAEKKYANAAIGALCPHDGNLLGRSWRWIKNLFWHTQINAVYVVATKSDLVVSNADRTNLKRLVDELVRGTLPFLASGIKTGTFSCAAICSTQEVKGENNERGLQGRLKVPGSTSQEYALASWIPSPVPPNAPESSQEWERMIAAGEFNYQFAAPPEGTGEIHPPPHFGLNVIVNELLLK